MRIAEWVRANCRFAAAATAEDVEFGSMLPKGSKGMLIDGNWVTWPVDRTGAPHHDEVAERRFRHWMPDVTATHWFDGTLSVFSSFGPFADETRLAINAFHGNRGSGSRIVIEGGDEPFEGSFRDYAEADYAREEATAGFAPRRTTVTGMAPWAYQKMAEYVRERMSEKLTNAPRTPDGVALVAPAEVRTTVVSAFGLLGLKLPPKKDLDALVSRISKELEVELGFRTIHPKMLEFYRSEPGSQPREG